MLTVRKRKNETTEQLIDRFIELCKREGIIKEYIKKRSYYAYKSQIKHQKERQRKHYQAKKLERQKRFIQDVNS